ncbi:GntR family transcriptional regulator [Burkholderia sp. Ac-20379]|uniref:GntR family transcriptional regulator n=1 Tax=Burkholderia sp. Ac-20379 TaxID=2703900 RepID=UPI0019821500|nr:GntR family transcriptional regulator [Burkholderia sp. Ac-20379]MBN3724171.1 GntR family transcriptional regulator [Burkholderia sp. Ac-20379]
MKGAGENAATVDPAQGGDRKTALSEALRRRIVNMELAPGALIDEAGLAEEFGMSRPPIRELIRQMAAEGYIELETNRAPRVSSMNFQSLRSFFLAAPVIYVATTQLAAVNATPDDIARLHAIQTHFRTAIENNDVASRVIYNDAFHLEIGRIAQNDYLMPSLRRLLIDHARLGKMFYRYPTTSTMQQTLETAVVQHDQIIEAIEQHDADKAGLLVREHFELSRRRMTEYAAPQGMAVSVNLEDPVLGRDRG